ncbi:hypothetical protein HME9302_01339 [Alteripontixanthobacter maritimus]|uniref:7 transmembrane helices usually fused to an inactive transglutaminase domain-containing protein n=1 Tax=Alteripontixanthobacter maritimus TaxID=2161824 RepID=A0A369Q6V9_9SPHN|nr:7TM domain-containing protein [Alteripontixanthobacter maritimus]RDC60140.1 hypothetical protein HME9302_01339 [Alteripontixanthobacter maritimus]
MSSDTDLRRARVRRRLPYIAATVLLFVFLLLAYFVIDDGQSTSLTRSLREGMGDPRKQWGFEPFYLLMALPLGATIVVSFRMALGVQTFGLFTPMLLSLSYLQTGPILGPVISTGAILIGMMIAPVLRKLDVSRVAFLGVLIAIVVTVLGSISGWLGDRLFVTAFPVVVTALVVERWWVTWEAEGLRKALKATYATLGVALLIAWVIATDWLGVVVEAAPPLVPALSGVAMLLLGKYKGLRLLEAVRFAPVREARD